MRISDGSSDVCSSDLEVKAIAANWSIETPSVDPETGEASTRKPIPADHIPLPFANDVAARAANNNAILPDLSLLTKRSEERSVGKACVSTGRDRWSPCH